MQQPSSHLPYQSFPDAPGASASLDKLKALRLPSLVGQRFLDIGCNEGFFCGYAKFAGARQVTGLDQSGLFIQQARMRYPDLHFLQQSWDSLPPGPFDVILLASSLHYTDTPGALIDRAVQVLAPGGTLVLELGVAEGSDCRWVEVDRGMDRRSYPTWAKLTEILAAHAWKLINTSVPQRGDPVPRYTLHINARMPIAYLLMQPPGYGKTTLCNSLFRPAGVPVVSGDQCLQEIASGGQSADTDLQRLVAEHFSPQAIDKTTLAVLQANLLPALINVWLSKANAKTCVLDSSLPQQHHAQVEEAFRAQGFLVITLDWQRPGAELQAKGKVSELADAYAAHLHASSQALPPKTAMPFSGTLGVVTKLDVQAGMLTIVGWAVHETGQMPSFFAVRQGAAVQYISAFERFAQPQLQTWLGLPHTLYGYRMTLSVPKDMHPDELPKSLQVYAGNDTAGPLSLLRSLPAHPLRRP